jgi:hypothetical protein
MAKASMAIQTNFTVRRIRLVNIASDNPRIVREMFADDQ